MANGNIDDIKRNNNDLWFWNTDVSVEPAVITVGTKGRDGSGNWRYTLVSGDGANFVRSEDAGLMRVSSVGGSFSVAPLSADSSTVSAVQADAGKLRVSAVGVSVTTSPLSADSSSISAKQSDASNFRISAFSGDAALMRVSSIGTGSFAPLSADSSNVSAIQADAGLLLVSAKSNDGALLRVSAGSPQVTQTPGDGTSNTSIAFPGSLAGSVISNKTFGLYFNSASWDRVRGDVSGAWVQAKDAGFLRTSAVQDDAGNLHTSAIVTNQVSATLLGTPNVGAIQLTSPWVVQAGFNNTDAGYGVVSAVQHDAGQLLVSGRSNDAGAFHASAYSGDGNQFHVSAVQGDAGLFHVSAIGTVTVSAHEVKQSDAAALLVSAKTDSAAQFRVSAFVDSGSISATQGDASNLDVSAKSLDAGTLLVSAKQGDAALFRISADAPTTTATLADGFSNTSIRFPANLAGNIISQKSYGMYFNSASWDRVRGDVSGAWVKLKTDVSGGGMSRYTTMSLSTAQLIKSNAGGAIYHVDLSLISASTPCIVYLYNVSAAPVLGTTAPDLIYVLSGSGVGAGKVRVDYPYGVDFSAGIGIAATSSNQNNATVVMAASSVMGQIIYK